MKKKSSYPRLKRAALGLVVKSLIISGTYVCGASSKAQACNRFMDDVLASARVSQDESYSGLTERACAQYVVKVPKSVTVVGQSSTHMVVGLHIGSLTFCYLDGALAGYSQNRQCFNRIKVRSYYSAFLEPGQVIELEVLDGYGAVAAQVEGVRP